MEKSGLAYLSACFKIRVAITSLLILFSYILVGCDVIAPHPTPTLPPRALEGRAVFQKICSTCHSATSDEIVVGPSLAGIATRGADRIPGMDAETYIRDSIINPGAYTVEGFLEGRMPKEVFESLTPGEFEAVVDYLMTLK